MKPCKALIFDCDGTLVDSMPAHYLAWRRTLDRYGMTFPEDRFYALGGVPTVKIVHMLAEEAGVVVDARAVAEEKEREFLRGLDAILPVEPVLRVARQHHGRLPMAVATGSGRDTVEKMLRLINDLHLFDTWVCSEDVTRHKPAPDVYLEAARRLSVPPEDCCVYEDTDTGVLGARAAGMDVVDVREFHRPVRQTA